MPQFEFEFDIIMNLQFVASLREGQCLSEAKEVPRAKPPSPPPPPGTSLATKAVKWSACEEAAGVTGNFTNHSVCHISEWSR